MIDAVSNVSLSAGVTQKSVAQTNAAAAAEIRQAPVPPQASVAGTPYIRIDNNLDMAIIEYRSSEGEVVHQYPTEAQIQAFSRAAEIEARSEQAVSDTSTAEINIGTSDTTSDAPVTIGGGSDSGSAPATTSAEAAPAPAVNVTADGGSVPAYSSSSQVVTA